MFDTVTKIIKRASIPALLIASVFSRFSPGYELLASLVICAGAIIGVQRAVQLREYWWAAGFVAVVIVFSPLALAVKIFLLLGLLCVATFVGLLAAFRTRPTIAA